MYVRVRVAVSVSVLCCRRIENTLVTDNKKKGKLFSNWLCNTRIDQICIHTYFI